MPFGAHTFRMMSDSVTIGIHMNRLWRRNSSTIQTETKEKWKSAHTISNVFCSFKRVLPQILLIFLRSFSVWFLLLHSLLVLCARLHLYYICIFWKTFFWFLLNALRSLFVHFSFLVGSFMIRILSLRWTFYYCAFFPRLKPLISDKWSFWITEMVSSMQMTYNLYRFIYELYLCVIEAQKIGYKIHMYIFE